MHLKTIMPALLFVLFGPVPSHAALAAKVEMQSLQIVPVETAAGKHPEIVGTIKASSVKAAGETTEVNVIASLVRPDHSVKSWTWKKISIKAGDSKSFSVPKEYDAKMEGVYKVDFGVYSKDMRPLHRLSKSFTVVDPSQPRAKTKSPQIMTRSTGTSSAKAPGLRAYDHRIGVGLSANLVNTAGGATLLFRPFKHVGLQTSYTTGRFSTAEGRLLAWFPLSARFTPYLGIGYASVTTERTVDVIGVKAEFTDSGVSGVIGAEIPLSKTVSGYVEVSGAGIDLKKEVTSGAQTGIATVEYSPVTVGFSIVYFLF